MTTTIIGGGHAGSAQARDLVIGGERVLRATRDEKPAEERGMESAWAGPAIGG